jgi:hypothetical protein
MVPYIARLEVAVDEPECMHTRETAQRGVDAVQSASPLAAESLTAHSCGGRAGPPCRRIMSGERRPHHGQGKWDDLCQ